MAAAGLSLRLVWRSGTAWILVLAAAAAGVAAAYESTYPTLAQRTVLASTVGLNPAFQALYGKARGLQTIGGFTAWRAGGPLTIIAAVWGLLAATRLVRGEEDSGRAEIVLAGGLSRRGALGASVVALAIMWAALWAALTVAFLAIGLATGGSVVLGFGIAAGFGELAAIGVLTAQVADDRRRAATLAGIALGAAFLLRVAADGTRTLGWMRWVTPLGWIEEIHAFTGTRLGPALVVVGFVAGCLAGAFVVLARRDLGAGLMIERNGRISYRFLGSVMAFTWRTGRGVITAWAAGIGTFALVLGLLAHDAARFAAANAGFRRIVAQLGVRRLVTAEGFIGLSFGFLVVAVAFYVATSTVAIRDEEATGRLENLLTRDVGRAGWLGAHVLVVAIGVLVVCAAAGLLAWVGTATSGHAARPGAMVVAAANCLPVAALFLGIGGLVFAWLPRATATISIGAVAIAYLVQFVGALANAPGWVLDLSPFHHVAPAPGAPVNAGAAVVMTTIGALAVAVALAGFVRRDVVGG